MPPLHSACPETSRCVRINVLTGSGTGVTSCPEQCGHGYGSPRAGRQPEPSLCCPPGPLSLPTRARHTTRSAQLARTARLCRNSDSRAASRIPTVGLSSEHGRRRQTTTQHGCVPVCLRRLQLDWAECRARLHTAQKIVTCYTGHSYARKEIN